MFLVSLPNNFFFLSVLMDFRSLCYRLKKKKAVFQFKSEKQYQCC